MEPFGSLRGTQPRLHHVAHRRAVTVVKKHTHEPFVSRHDHKWQMPISLRRRLDQCRGMKKMGEETAELLHPPGDCHAYNDVCFKGDITSLWWKCVSPSVIIIGPHCSYLRCARLRLSRWSEWLKGWFWGIDTMTFIAVTNFLIATFITWTSNKAWLTVAVPQTYLRRTHVSLKFLFNTFWTRNNLFTSTVCTQFLLSL